MDGNINLTEQEVAFCELYVNGTAPYAGNAMLCYDDVFGKKSKNRGPALRLLNEPRIKNYIEELESLSSYEAKRRREYLARHLEQIIEETSIATYTDRKGLKISPAAMRSVCVQAMKLYSELYPVKEAQVSKLNIESNGGGITFNVIVPNQDKQPEE